MRFALRNKTKLIQAFGEDEYNRILSSLKQYAKERDEPETRGLIGKGEAIDVNTLPNNPYGV